MQNLIAIVIIIVIMVVIAIAGKILEAAAPILIIGIGIYALVSSIETQESNDKNNEKKDS